MDAILNERVGDRKARTPQEVRNAAAVSRLGHPGIKVWIAEGLEEAAREVWDACGAGEQGPVAENPR